MNLFTLLWAQELLFDVGNVKMKKKRRGKSDGDDDDEINGDDVGDRG